MNIARPSAQNSASSFARCASTAAGESIATCTSAPIRLALLEEGGETFLSFAFDSYGGYAPRRFRRQRIVHGPTAHVGDQVFLSRECLGPPLEELSDNCRPRFVLHAALDDLVHETHT